MEKASQDNNIISVETDLGKDKLHITSLEAVESISTLFSIQLNVYANEELVVCDRMIGTDATITILLGGNNKRYLHGQITNLRSLGSRVSADADGHKYQDYQLTVSPDLWSLNRRTNCKIFQKKNIEDIVRNILSVYGIKSKFELNKTHAVYDYKVQYHESDFSFISRLLEDEGIFYFFEHVKGAHTIVFSDDVASYRKSPEGQVAFTTGSLSEAHIHSWSGSINLPSTKAVIAGYDFAKPTKKPCATATESDELEVYEYVSESEWNNRSNLAAEVTLASLQKDRIEANASSNCRSFTAGHYFSFSAHEDPAEINKSYLITKSHLVIKIASQTGAEKQQDQLITNSISCIPVDVCFVPSQLTVKPTITGVQTAVVTGDSTDEITIDKYGRVKVLFHWDREGILDSASSCWVRVAQNWAGDRWGAFFFPRKGQEVLVEFLGGDPDQPIIIGAVYNGDLMPPYDLPSEKTVSGIKTRSSKSGGADNFNEIKFEDAKGKELLYAQAEKDLELLVKNDRTETIKRDRLTQINKDDTTAIKGERVTEVGKSDKLTIGKELVIDAGSKITIKTGGASITLSSSGSVDIKGSKISINGSAIALKAGSISLN
ncbi:type VI secretion system tip protein VgrG [Corallincola luteus]|uniref:Type VI secretion system tip protein VgrG n=1 Tax=Corallincola luteus TaxID=1775177 RepID=A0ABY2AK59_9GAMM|nr:type VI secretion system tip protein TssI/VgrG [Corallincola luteus]TCI03225.1 type VI secretion system tip protein VgrG [Corallincola luteus]